MNVAIIIPAFNEQATVSNVCKANSEVGHVIVVDDGSDDITADLAFGAGAFVVAHEKNLGYDRALFTGFQSAINLGYKYAVTTDADGEISSEAVEKAVIALKAGSDIVVGRRNKYNRWSEHVFSLAARLFWRIEDPLCGLKGYNLELFQKLDFQPNYDSVGTFFMSEIIRLPEISTHQFDVIVTPRDSTSRFGKSLTAEIKILKAMVFSLFRSSLNRKTWLK